MNGSGIGATGGIARGSERPLETAGSLAVSRSVVVTKALLGSDSTRESVESSSLEVPAPNPASNLTEIWGMAWDAAASWGSWGLAPDPFARRQRAPKR